MRGLLVVGLSGGADERAAGEAVASALARGGVPAVPVTLVALGDEEGAGFPTLASPLTAARHAGARLEPAELAGRARDAGEGDPAVVATVAGGLLAPLTPRYAVRDLALELGLGLVLAARAQPDAVNLVRLSAEAARGAGLSLAAVVLTGWPDPPDRVLLDERRLLGELAGLPVLTLPAAAGAQAEAARGWPAAEWLDAAPSAAAVHPIPDRPVPSPSPSPSPVVLEPFTAWQPRPMGDPRTTPRPQLMAAVLDIVSAEGPMRASRAYALYNRAAGGKKLTSIARAPLSSAVHWLARDGQLALTKAEEIPWQDDDLVRTPDAPAVRVRELGARALEEVPLDEIAELMRRLRAAGHPAEPAALKRAVLTAYGLVRLTGRADEYLTLALGLAE